MYLIVDRRQGSERLPGLIDEAGDSALRDTARSDGELKPGSNADDLLVEAGAASVPAPPSAFLGHQTAKSAVAYLLGLNEGYYEPTRKERDALLVGFAKARKPLHGAAFDLVRVTGAVDLSDAEAIHRNIGAVVICEVKSTNRMSMPDDFRGYFFNVTAGELLTAQALGSQYRFLFVNTVLQTHMERSLQEVFGAAKAMYPAWHIRF